MLDRTVVWMPADSATVHALARIGRAVEQGRIPFADAARFWFPASRTAIDYQP